MRTTKDSEARRHARRRPWGLAGAALLAATALACGSGDGTEGSGGTSGTQGSTPGTDAGSGELLTIRVAHNGNAANLALRVAAEQGFLEEHGLQAEFEIIDNVGTIPPVVGRDFDIGMVTPTALLAASAQGLDLVWVAGMIIANEDEPVGELIASAESGVTSIADLPGHTLGVLTEQGTLHIATRAWLAREGLDYGAVNVVQVDGPSHREQLAGNRVDVIETVDPFKEAVRAVEGAVTVGYPFLELAPDGIRTLAYVSTGAWAAEHPDAVAGLRAAIDEAIAYIADHDAEARAVLQEYSGLPEAVVQSAPFPVFVSDPSVEDLQRWHDVMRELGLLQADVDVASLVVD